MLCGVCMCGECVLCVYMICAMCCMHVVCMCCVCLGVVCVCVESNISGHLMLECRVAPPHCPSSSLQILLVHVSSFLFLFFFL